MAEKFCIVAAGEADLYPQFGRTMQWDTAAGDAVPRAAGGFTRSFDDGPFPMGRELPGRYLLREPAFLRRRPGKLSRRRRARDVAPLV